MRGIILLVSLVLFIVIAVQNTDSVGLSVIGWHFSLPKGLFVLLFLIFGYVIGLLAPSGKK